MSINKRIAKKIYLILIVLLFVLTLLAIYLWHYKEPERNYINELRLETNDLHQKISSQWPIEVSSSLSDIEEVIADYPDISIIVIDIDENIVYSNTDKLILDEEKILLGSLYMDDYYITTNPSIYKLSQPLYNDDEIVGFIIFEKMYSIKPSNKSILKNIIITADVFVMIILIALFGMMLFSKRKRQFEDIKKGLDDASKGVLKPIKIPRNTEYEQLYISYNILIEELGYMAKKQYSLDAHRKRFITMISHEIKTPIATINAYVEGLIKGVANSEIDKKRYIKIIYDKIGQLTQQVDDFFKYAQVEANTFKYNFGECYADELIDDIFINIIASNRPFTKIKNDLPKCIVKVDKIRLEQVISNLYNNAIKHTASEDEIKLSAYREDHSLVIKVEDKGEGINPKDLPYIFDYYYQGQSSKKMDYDGVGLGLAICKQIVDSHNGVMKVKSSLGLGTTMVLKIPLS